MSAFPVRTIRKNLCAKGFVEERAADHIYFYLTVNGKRRPIFTKVSHSAAEIGDHLQGIMAKQVKLNRRQFSDLISCQMSAEQYLSAAGIVPDQGDS